MSSPNSSSLTQVRPDVLRRALEACVLARRPAFVWGSPGIGKSQIIRKLAQDHGALFIDVRASQWDAVDTRGVPFVENNTTRWAIPSVFPSAALAAQYQLVVIVLEELNSAPPSVQAALYQLVLDRRLGDYVLPPNVVVLAAGNLETDRAVTHRMSTALANRFVHLELVVDGDAWERWALANDVHVAPISYMRWRPAHLHAWESRSTSKAQPTPRSWEIASDLVKVCEASGINGEVERALLAGTLGEAVGAEFSGFLRIYRTLPDPAAVIMAPMSAALSEDPAVNYALCGALAERTTVNNVHQVFTYATRLRDFPAAGPEFMTLLVRGAAIRHPEIQQTMPFIKWASANSEVLL